jgi:hypothetical protein
VPQPRAMQAEQSMIHKAVSWLFYTTPVLYQAAAWLQAQITHVGPRDQAHFAATHISYQPTTTDT